MLYSYISPRFGYKPIIAYRLILALYTYILPIIPDVYVYFRTFCRMIYPFIIYVYIENYYNPDKELIRRQDKRKENIIFLLTSLVLISFICLVFSS